MTDLAPCSSCPWRRGATPDRIPAFDEEKATCSLPACVGDEDAFRPIMACHLSTDGDDRPCIGYLAGEESYGNLMARLHVARTGIDWARLWELHDDWDLYDTFDEMMAALVPSYEPRP